MHQQQRYWPKILWKLNLRAWVLSVHGMNYWRMLCAFSPTQGKLCWNGRNKCLFSSLFFVPLHTHHPACQGTHDTIPPAERGTVNVRGRESNWEKMEREVIGIKHFLDGWMKSWQQGALAAPDPRCDSQDIWAWQVRDLTLHTHARDNQHSNQLSLRE